MKLDLERKNFENITFFYGTRLKRVMNGENPFRLFTRNEGDLLAIMHAGAYGFSMSSEYNSRPRAAEVLVSDGRYDLVRERGVPEDLLSDQKEAHWLRGNRAQRDRSIYTKK